MAAPQRAERPLADERQVAHPPVASRAEWLSARKTLLAHEKELTKHYDRINAERRRLPMDQTAAEPVVEAVGYWGS